MSDPPKAPQGIGVAPMASAGTLGTRAWDLLSRLATLTKSQERHDRQLEQLAQQVAGLAQEMQRLAGRMDGIDKRFDEKDRMVELLIAVKVRDEIDKQPKA